MSALLGYLQTPLAMQVSPHKPNYLNPCNELSNHCDFELLNMGTIECKISTVWGIENDETAASRKNRHKHKIHRSTATINGSVLSFFRI